MKSCAFLMLTFIALVFVTGCAAQKRSESGEYYDAPTYTPSNPSPAQVSGTMIRPVETYGAAAAAARGRGR